MGTFQVAIEVGDPDGQRYETVEALVDSGATYTTMPESLLRRLRVAPFSKRTFVLADGTRIERDFGQTWVRLDGEHAISPVVFGDEGAMPLLGALTLEVFSLGIDPVNKRLIPVESLMLPVQSLSEQP